MKDTIVLINIFIQFSKNLIIISFNNENYDSCYIDVTSYCKIKRKSFGRL
jgi:hypothetical protein